MLIRWLGAPAWVRARASFRAPALLGAALALIGLTASAVGAAADTHKAHQPDCDRRCLLQILQTYTEALLDNDVSRIKAAPTLRAT